MDKNVKLKMISKASWLLGEYSPVTHLTNPTLFMVLQNKFEKFEKWYETEQIPRADFEELLKRDEDLVDAYLEVYSKKATFYKCIISDEPRHFQYFIMKKNNALALLFYRNVEIVEID
jgi:hypothetical protein